MRAVREGDGAWAVFAFLPLDLVGDELDRLVPRDAHVTRLAAVLWIALAVRIVIDALHRVEQAIRRIDDGFRILPVRRQRGLARRRQLHALGLDGPRRAVFLGQVDRRHADDFAVLDVDEDRPAVGHVAIARDAALELLAVFEPGRLAQHQGLREPVGQIFRAVDGEIEILLRVDLVEPVDRRHQQPGADLGVLEHQLDVGLFVQAGAGRDHAVVERVPAADLLVARHDLRHEIVLFHPRLEFRVPPRCVFEESRHTEQDDGQLHRGKCHVVLLISRHSARARSARGMSLKRRGRLEGLILQ